VSDHILPHVLIFFFNFFIVVILVHWSI
jgi:hypothetical protein